MTVLSSVPMLGTFTQSRFPAGEVLKLKMVRFQGWEFLACYEEPLGGSDEGLNFSSLETLNMSCVSGGRPSG